MKFLGQTYKLDVSFYKRFLNDDARNPPVVVEDVVPWEPLVAIWTRLPAVQDLTVDFVAV